MSLQHATYDPLVAMTRDFSQGHVEAPGGIAVQRPVPANSAEYGAGFLYMSASDVVRMGSALMSGGKLDGKRVFRREAVAAVTGGYIAIPGTPHNRAGYGVQVDVVGGEKVWRKSGSVTGYASELSMWPERDFAVAISINRHDPMMPIQANVRVAQLVRSVAVAAAVPALPDESDGSAAQRAAVAGHYRINDGGTVEIVERDGRLDFVGRRGTFPIRFRGPDRLIVKAPAPVGREFLVLRDADGAVEFLHVGSRAFPKQPTAESVRVD